MAKLILYQAKSPYQDDYTKNCALTGKEVDNNFLNLKGDDVKDVKLDENTKILTVETNKNGLRNCNGDIIDGTFSVDLKKLQYVVGYEFDTGGTGTINILYSDGSIEKMSPKAFGLEVATDSSINGTGTISNPLSISQAFKTGQYQAVKDVIDVTGGEVLPTGATFGDGYITKEVKSQFGMFYSGIQAKALNDLLASDGSGWRVPTKGDWDSLLNYLEKCESSKNHGYETSSTTIANSGITLGNMAGARSKSHDDYWNNGSGKMNEGVLRIYPTGSFPSPGNTYTGFGDYSEFWTITNGTAYGCERMFTKKFHYNVSGVIQTEKDPTAFLSIRLVKDFIGDNYHQFEEIHGHLYETKLFVSDVEDIRQVWTMVNVDIQDLPNIAPKSIPEDATTAVTVQNAFYINRWNGNSWDKHEMSEGDCVVILDMDSSSGMAEYRVENGELVNLDERGSGKIREIWEALTELSAFTNDVAESLDAEVSARTEFDDAVSAVCDSLQEQINSGLTEIENLQVEVGELSGVCDGLQEQIDALSGVCDDLREQITGATADVQEQIDALNSGLTSEEEERKATDEELLGMITAETKTRKDVIGTPSDKPLKSAVEYTDEDFENGVITVFGFINASNDYGYNLD